jgi:hypothetical protein
VITVTYSNGEASAVIEVDRPPEEVIEFARARIYPNVAVLQFDERWARAHEEWSKSTAAKAA